jgi:hypothetical protein
MNTPATTIHWRDIRYLQHGTAQQQRAFKTLSDLDILSFLKDYDPILVSTVCLDIATHTSDLDIICEVHDHKQFLTLVARRFGGHAGFSSRATDRVPPATVIQFFTKDFEIELFAQALPVEQQVAYQHLCQAHRIIQFGGERVRKTIQKLKIDGLKTEPAIAKLLGLHGDPYLAVLHLRDVSDEALLALINKALLHHPRAQQ